MIVERLPLVGGLAEAPGVEPARRSPGPDDDTFGRTLTDVLQADRRDRPPARSRRHEQEDDRPPETTGPRNDRPITADDHGDQRVGDDDPVAMNEGDRTDAESGDDEQTTDGDRPTGADSRPDADSRFGSDVDADDERTTGRTETVAATVVAGLAAALQKLHVDTSAGDDAGEEVDAAGPAPAASSAESEPVVAIEPAVGGARAAGETAAQPTAEANGEVENVATPRRTGITVDDGGGDGIDLDGSDRSAGAEDVAESAERIDAPVSDGEPAAEPTESSDEEEAAGAAPGMATDGGPADGTTAAARAALADGRRSALPDAEPAAVSPESNASTEESDATGVATIGRPATARTLETETEETTGDPPTSPDTGDFVDRTDTQPGTDHDQTVDRPAGSISDRPASGLSPVASHRAPDSTPLRSTTAAAETSSPVPELVELQTTGLAERLRPAFAAVRRGVNGLDELRLRIQDDNAGPIKVDIATVDNRVRVVLSAGNDDLMRQLGQERDRLADELRRAGFDQASIDIESNHRGRRNSPYDQEASGRSASGPAGAGSPAATATDSIPRTSLRRDRGPTGLDLDL